MSYSLGSAFAGSAVVQAPSKSQGKNNGKDQGSGASKDNASNGIGYGVADNSGVVNTGPPNSQGIGYGVTDRSVQAAAAAVATTSSSDNSAWGGMRSAAWGGSSSSDAVSGSSGGFASASTDAGFGVGRGGGGSSSAGSASAASAAGFGGGSDSRVGGGFGGAAGRGGGGTSGGEGARSAGGAGFGGRSGRSGAGGTSGGAGRSGGGGGGASAASAGGGGRGGGGGGNGARGRRLLDGAQPPDTAPNTAASLGRQLLQIAGVSAGAISTVGSGPDASLGQLGAAGSDYRASWASQATQQSASGSSSMGQKSLALLPGIDWWGLAVLGCGLLLVLLYMLLHLVKKRRATARLKMDPCVGGALRLAAARGDIATMQALADGSSRFHVDADHEGFTPLHAAAVEGKAVALLWLCQHGADVAAVKDDGWHDSALHYAAAKGHMHCCQVLIAHGAQLDAKNYAGQTAADVAARSSHSRLATYLKKVAAGTTPKPSKNSIPAPLRRQLASAVSQYQQAVTADAQAAGVPEPIAAAAGAIAPLNTGIAVTSSSRLSLDLPAQAAAVAAQPGVGAGDVAAAAAAATKRLAKAAAKRGWEGVGSQGTQLAQGVTVFRVLAVCTQLAMLGYIVWRALRTLNPGWSYLISVPVWCCEFAGCVLSNVFVMSLWNQIERSPRRLEEMLAPEDMPGVDIFVPTYSEPPEIIEPTVIAALNMNYPGSRMTVHVLDDGARPEVAAMVSRLRFQMTYMGREAEVRYVARIKAKGTPHHAKAGNINSALLKESAGSGTFVLVLDCDMIAHPDFLQNILGHFYKQEMPDGPWTLKDKAGFIQTPQDFWNVDAADPLVHSARFFYGPMLQGRDGIGACPCCGTGVVFKRDTLIALGGQSYGSITEDYNTAMNMLGAGFATMFLNERLVFGMAPDDLEAALTQRLRWAMGALQILSRTNPLSYPGLNLPQSVLFYEALAHHWLAIATVALGVLPIPFLFTGYSPVVAPAMWEFTLAFGCFYLLNRIMLWWVHRHVEGGTQEMWRGSQMWVWISPNHIKAIWKVLVAENRLFMKLFAFEITFAVTSKDKQEPSRSDALRSVLSCVWPYLLWIAGFAAGVCFFVVKACMGAYGPWQLMTYFISIMWGSLILLSIWPPISTMLPREETEAGWKISWDVILRLPGREERQAGRAALQQGVSPGELIRQKASTKDRISIGSTTDGDDDEALDVVPGFDDDDISGLRGGSSSSAARQGSGGLLSRGRASLDVVADHVLSLLGLGNHSSSPSNEMQQPDAEANKQQQQQRRGSLELQAVQRQRRQRRHSAGNTLVSGGGLPASGQAGNGSAASWSAIPFTGFDVVDEQLQPQVLPRRSSQEGSGFGAAFRRRSMEAQNPRQRQQHTSNLAAVHEDAEPEEAPGGGSSDPADSNSGSFDTAVIVEATPAAGSPFAAAGLQIQASTGQQGSDSSGVSFAPSCGIFSSLLYSSSSAAQRDTAAAAVTAQKSDQPKSAAAASNFGEPMEKASSFSLGSKDADAPAAAAGRRPPRASIDNGTASDHSRLGRMAMGRLGRMSNRLGRVSSGPLTRMSMDVAGRHRQQQQQRLLQFSPAAEAARATGTSALGRISLPGRSRAVMEASSLYTQLILPEPTASAPGGRAGSSQRLLAVTADGALLPGGMVNDASFPGRISEGSREGTSFDSNSSWSWVGSIDNNIQPAGRLSNVDSITVADKDADATVLQLPMGGSAAAAVADLDRSSTLNNSGPGTDFYPVVQGQLQQLAAAVITKRVSMDLQRNGSSRASRNSIGSFTFRRPSAASAGSAFADVNCSRQPSATADMAGWTVAESVLAGNTAADNNFTEMFNTQAAVIPTLPENIFEHTIAAVPNFGARSAPKASWMFFIVNFVLLVALFGASFVEVYCN